jgi:indole-3-glycerol phosphate synthase
MILDKIVKCTKERIEKEKKEVSLDELIDRINDTKNSFAFEDTLKSENISFICEIKRASPSKGIISNDFNYIEIAKEYEKGGASAISVLTEPFFFKGNNQYILDILPHVSIPILRKDFVVDKYMIYESKILGASAVLLIVSILNKDQLKEYIKLSYDVGLSPLVEAHNHEEIKIAISAGAKIIGVNNRNLKNFEVDINNSIKLRESVPKNILFVSESGIKTPEDVKLLKNNNINGILIGESLMRSDNKVIAINYLKSLINTF